MNRKVLISFLGAIPYYDTKYFFLDRPNEIKEEVPYVQQVLVDSLLPSWTEGDKIYIFSTREALENNWKHRIKNFDRETGKPQYYEYENGLSNYFIKQKDSGNIVHFKAPVIPNGYTEDEIWEVFSTVVDTLQADDEIYLDITFGFRSLPMLAVVLLNYAKTIHQGLEVKAIYYGNYEAGRAQQQQRLQQALENGVSKEAYKELQNETIEAPILNLKSFVELQQWTQAAYGFLRFGDASALSNLSEEDYPQLSESLSHFTDGLFTSRGKLLIEDFNFEEFRNNIQSARTDTGLKAQLKPLLERISNRLNQFKNKEILNGFQAVEWCIQHNLIPQGYTMLQESVVTWVINKRYGKDYIYNYEEYRSQANGALSGFKRPPNGPDPIQKEIFDYLKQNYPQLRRYYKKLTGKGGLRNDINHGGFNNNPASPQELKAELKDLYSNTKSVLSSLQNLNEDSDLQEKAKFKVLSLQKIQPFDNSGAKRSFFNTSPEKNIWDLIELKSS